MSGDIKNIYDQPARSGKTESLVILLHGLGSNGRDLISLSPYYSQKLPDTAFVSPDAPFACDMAPPGYPDSYQWFSLQSRDPKDMLNGVQMAWPILKNFLGEQCEKYNVPADKCALVGFSQGTMMSLYAASRYKDQLAGILGYSGALLWESNAKIAHKPPVHLIHGEADDVVPVEAYHAARGALIGQGFQVTGHTTPNLPHSIDEAGISSGAAFLKSILCA